MKVLERTRLFDKDRGDALRLIWFVGDVHGEFKYLANALQAAELQPRWIVFAGDIDIDHMPFREILEPIKRWNPMTRVAFIHGNHDADSYEHWEMLHDYGDALPLHGQVIDMGGVRVAGLGGHFIGKVWYPPTEPRHMDQKEALGGGAFRYRDGQRPAPKYLAAIYPDQLNGLKQCRADILVTHEAPSCHPHGFEVLDDLARAMNVQRNFHGHHHDDRTQEYGQLRERLGFDAVALAYCNIKNGLGQVIFEGVPGL